MKTVLMWMTQIENLPHVTTKLYGEILRMGPWVIWKEFWLFHKLISVINDRGICCKIILWWMSLDLQSSLVQMISTLVNIGSGNGLLASATTPTWSMFIGHNELMEHHRRFKQMQILLELILFKCFFVYSIYWLIVPWEILMKYQSNFLPNLSDWWLRTREICCQIALSLMSMDLTEDK